jgi:hypothetical protein
MLAGCFPLSRNLQIIDLCAARIRCSSNGAGQYSLSHFLETIDRDSQPVSVAYFHTFIVVTLLKNEVLQNGNDFADLGGVEIAVDAYVTHFNVSFVVPRVLPAGWSSHFMQ